MESSVGQLALRIRAEAGHAGRLRSAAETYARRVLERCDAVLEARAPGRIFLIERLDLSIRTVDPALADDTRIDVLATEIADAVEQAADRDARDVVAFADEAAWRAAHAEARSGGQAVSWAFAALEAEGDPLTALLLPSRIDLLHGVVATLYARGSLTMVLDRAPDDVVACLAATLGVEDGASAGGMSDRRMPADLTRVLAALRAERGLRARIVLAAAAGQRGAAADETAVSASARSPLPHEATAVASPREAPDSISSRFGGAFYLLGPALELAVGEAAWRACLPESAVVFEAMTTLLREAGQADPAPRLMSGSPLPPMSVSLEQQHEASEALLTEFVRAIPRRGLGRWPTPLLRLVDTPQGRLVACAALGTPFVFFARSGRTADEIDDGVGSFLRAWPASAPSPRADRVLAEFGRRGRLRPSRDGCTLLVANGSSLEAAALGTQAVGVLGALFAARVQYEGSQTEFVDRYLSIPATIETHADTLVVRLPMDRIDVDVRRGGLDRSPGWIPWLGRVVLLEFEDPPDPSGMADG